MSQERPTEPPSACQNKEEAITILKDILYLNSNLDYYTILLVGAHTYMRDVLPQNVCLYLAFDGAKSSGKTTATKATILLSHNGRLISSTTPAALRRTLDGGVTIGLDEIDAQTFKNEALETLLRVGNSWNAEALLCQSNGKDIVVVPTNVGGPKIFNFRGDIDDALRSRCLIIDMPSRKDSDLAINVLFMGEALKDAREWLRFEVESKLKALRDNAAFLGMTPQAFIEADMKSDDFRRKVRGIEASLGRNAQQAAILLEIDRIMGWGLEDQIKEIIEGQQSEDPFEIEKEIIADIYLRLRQDNHQSGLNDGSLITISSQELLLQLNQELKKKGLRDLSSNRYATIKREVGWQDKINVKKSSASHGKLILSFDVTVLKNLGLEGHF